MLFKKPEVYVPENKVEKIPIDSFLQHTLQTADSSILLETKQVAGKKQRHTLNSTCSFLTPWLKKNSLFVVEAWKYQILVLFPDLSEN